MRANKATVNNPMEMFSTVGAELLEMLEEHGVTNGAEAMGMKCLEQKEYLSDRQIAKACALLSDVPDLDGYLRRWQDDYAQRKVEAQTAFASYRTMYGQAKAILPMLGDEFMDGRDVLDDLLDYLGVDTVEEVEARMGNYAALYRKQGKTKINPIHLYGWLRRGELDFAKMQLPAYDAAALQAWIDGRSWEAHLDDADYLKQLPAELATMGVALVLVQYLPNTVYGAVRWMDGHPLVQISDRGNDLAACWFTLTHELGHVLLHAGETVIDGELNNSKAEQTAKERAANKFANGYLFGGDDLRKRVFAIKKSGERWTIAEVLAAHPDVSPSMVYYWLRQSGLVNRGMYRLEVSFARG